METNKSLIILRGLPGAGKSTFAKLISNGNDDIVCTADDYFTHDGTYSFDADKLHEAHCACRHKFNRLLDEDTQLIIVANTNIKEKDFSYYESKAKEHNYQIFHIVVENRHGNTNIHNVPNNVIQRMKNNFSIQP